MEAGLTLPVALLLELQGIARRPCGFSIFSFQHVLLSLTLPFVVFTLTLYIFSFLSLVVDVLVCSLPLYFFMTIVILLVYNSVIFCTFLHKVFSSAAIFWAFPFLNTVLSLFQHYFPLPLDDTTVCFR